MSPLQRRILMMIVPPLAALVIGSLFLIVPAVGRFLELRQAEQLVTLVDDGLHELHGALLRERMHAAALLAGGGEDWAAKLREARAETDRRLEQVKQTVAARAGDDFGFGKALEKLDRLGTIRATIDRREITPVEGIRLYGEPLLAIRSMVAYVRNAFADLSAASLLATLTTFFELEDASGAVAAYGTVLLRNATFEPQAFAGYAGARELERWTSAEFRARAAEGVLQVQQAAQTRLAADGLGQFTDILDAIASTFSTEGLAPERWMELQAARAEAMSDVERAILDRLAEVFRTDASAAGIVALLTLATTASVVGFAGLLAWRGIGAVGQLEEEERQAREAAEAKRRRAAEELAGRFGQELGTLVGGLREIAHELEGHAKSVDGEARAAGGESSSAAELSRRAAGNVGTIAAACEELATSAREIAGQITRSSGMTRDVTGRVQQTDRTMSELAAVAEEIGQIVGLIAEIAEKTNLLALNATIEAARAGEAGRGFAVVAQEVKSLAGQTGEATRKIAEQVQTVQAAARGAVGAINEVRGAMDELDRIAAAVAAAVEEQNAAIADVARNAQEAAGGMEEIAKRAGSASDKVQQAQARSAAMMQLVGETVKRTRDLEGRLHDLLTSIRTAA